MGAGEQHAVLHAGSTVVIVFVIGYGALYEADDDRDPEVGGVPLRFVSLVALASLSVLLLALAFDVPDTFLGESTGSAAELAYVTFKAVSVGAIFSVVGRRPPTAWSEGSGLGSDRRDPVI